ncbi:molybdenum ABC transporter ATP-binding protein [Arenibacterium halophilum]|uniref:Molybdenum ABC transporter ATP-binding protein n=1 Tax=Arenibacterium halophilum TaxID=2583821 RepID=A0ABY2XDE6_9RHOB|nr:molybdenum ABC transporter ATP-binding protein [Arenibacterium halophilum]TMV15039.1 molybdenum ABC transporter ATP-binding protein [Arenibacterium halophilum]
MSLSVSITRQQGDFTLDAAFDAPEGITALLGKSGSGKTSIVNAVAGLVRPDRGRITLDGEVLFDSARGMHVPPSRRRLGYVFQDGRLFPHFNVRQNLTYGLRFAPSGATGPDLASVCDMLGLSHLTDRRPGALSGGEKQRVAIGRALLSRPRMLLMDEPLASLDSARKAEILPYLERLRDDTGLPILYVSHSVPEIARLATTVVLIDAGKVTGAGPAERILSDPSVVRQIGLREAGAVIPTRVLEHHDDGLSELVFSGGRLLLPRIDKPPETPVRVRILAHDVILSLHAPQGMSALNTLPVTVLSLREGDGPGMIAQLQCGDDRLLARITRRSATAMDLSPGKPLFAVIKSVAVARADVGAG